MAHDTTTSATPKLRLATRLRAIADWFDDDPMFSTERDDALEAAAVLDALVEADR